MKKEALNNNRPSLLITFGYPGSGKTYFSERLAKKANFFHLSSDRVRSMLFKKPTFSKPEHKIVFGFIDYLAQELLKKGMSVIYDANFNFRKNRKDAQKIAKRANGLYQLIWIKTDEGTAISRLGKRAKLKNAKKKELYKTVSVSVFRKMQAEMQIPAKSESFIVIDGHAPFSEQYKQFIKDLKSKRNA